MKLGPVTWLIPSSAAQLHGQWIFLCFRNSPAVSDGMPRRQRRVCWHGTSGPYRWVGGDGTRCDGTRCDGTHRDGMHNGWSDGWAELGMKDRGPGSCTNPGQGRPGRG